MITPARLLVVALAAVLAWAPAAVGGTEAWTSGDQPGGRPTALALAGDLGLAGMTGGGAGGAIHRSTDGGATWSRVTGFPPEDVFGVAVHPTGLALAATRQGLYRSIDGGARWTEVVPTGAAVGDFWFGAEIDISRPSHVIATRFSVSGGGVWRSADGGVTWTRLSAGLPNDFAVSDAVIDPATHLAWGWGGSGIFVISETGTTWGAGNSGLPSLSVSEVVVDAGGARVIARASGDLVWLPSGGGPSWQPLEGGLPANHYATELATDAAGNAWTVDLFDSGVRRLPAGAATWALASSGLPSQEPALLVADRAGSRALAVPPALNAGESAIYRTTDGANWGRSGSGYAAVGVNAVGADPRVPGRVLVATQEDAVRRSLDGGATWLPGATGLPPGEIESIVADGRTPDVFYAGVRNAGVFRSTDAGASWVAIGAGDPGTPVQLEADPNRAGLLYTRFNSDLYRSSDAGANWIPLPTGGLGGSSVRSMAPDRAAPGAVYAVGSGVFHLAEGAVAWTSRSAGLSAGIAVVDLAIDPRDPAHLIIATSDGVWRSDDSGAGWRKATGVAGQVFSVAIDPQSGEVWAATLDRAFRSRDGGAGFAEADPGLRIHLLREMEFDADGRTLYGATAAGLLARTRAVPETAAVTPPGVIRRPVIAGARRPAVARVLRASPALFGGLPVPTVTTRWQRCGRAGTRCRDIRGAGLLRYRPVLADVGRRLRLVQRATNPLGVAVVRSNLTSPVPSPASVAGRPRVGSTLRARLGATGLRRPRITAVVWLRCTRTGTRCRPISGATGRTHSPESADTGRRLRVRIALRAGGRRVTLVSAPTARVRARARASAR